MSRLDRTFTLALDRVFRGLVSRRVGVPVLMYHSISADEDERSHPYYRTNTTPERFRMQMQWLAEQGYAAKGLDAGLLENGQEGQKRVVITFDDGFAGVAENAAPILSQHGFTATVFLPTAFIADTRREFVGRPCLTWAEVRDLRSAGFSFGSHTAHHRELIRLPAEEMRRELSESRERIEQELRERVTTFSYPFAFPEAHRSFVQRFRSLLAETGYTKAVTTRIGTYRPGDDLLTIKRLPVNSDDDRALFAAKLRGAYNWMGGAQRVVKYAGRMLGRRGAA